jgi:hypothetical protein
MIEIGTVIMTEPSIRSPMFITAIMAGTTAIATGTEIAMIVTEECGGATVMTGITGAGTAMTVAATTTATECLAIGKKSPTRLRVGLFV